jgi:23S rRNA pseudouridine2605 synthase
MAERLQKLLAAAGLGSRREIEGWIAAGRVTVNGVVAALGQGAEPADSIAVDGRPVLPGPAAAREVLLYHKPAGEVTTRFDPQRRPTVFDRLPPPRSGRWVVVGRLDTNTTGLLLFTNDGELAHRLMHPSSMIEREYVVRVRGLPPAATLQALSEGLMLEDGMARFDRIEPLNPSAGHAWYRVTLHEGRNREVRRLWSAAGYEVSRLCRTRFGNLRLPEDLRPGSFRWLDPGLAATL